MIVDFVREAAIRDQKFIAEFDQSGRGDQAGANITERVQAITGFDIRRKADDVGPTISPAAATDGRSA